MKTFNASKQIELTEEIQKININLVTCSNCGEIQLVDNTKDITCFKCGITGEQSDFPDLFHNGMTINGERIGK